MAVHKRPVLLLAGATAVGKSAVAIEIAEQVGGEIVSADARQVYRQLNIGTAKPPEVDRRRIPHHLIDICDPTERYSAAQFRRDAVAAIEAIHGRGLTALVVGGTGLYFRALTEGLFDAPEVRPEAKSEAAAIEREGGLAALVRFLEENDPQTLEEIDRQNPARVRRAVEFYLQTGESLVGFRGQTHSDPLAYQWIMAHLTRPREELHRRIEARVDEMLAAGWLEEVSSLAKRHDFSEPAFNALGYRELRDTINGRVDLKQARQTIIERTRQYARRQLTWFRHQGPWQEFPAESKVSAKIALGLAKSAENKSA